MGKYIVLMLSSLIAALISGAASFDGSLLLLPVLTLYIGANIAIPVLTIAQLIGNLSRMAFGLKQIGVEKSCFIFNDNAPTIST